ncbi:MAG: 1-acyl-sn-glycerol-3-phosphate acyltransferase [Thermoanaerobaculia bacterium]
MSQTVDVPLWLAVLAALLAAWALVDRLFVPGVRWLIRQRARRLLESLEIRFQVRVEPFKLTKREALVERLVWDPEVQAAVEVEARTEGAPRDVVFSRVKTYAREIVPAFNAYAYFRVGYSIARALARSLFRVRIGYADEEALAKLPPGATVVFVMNHRSNMDYLLVAYLVAEKTALSYAVGEWARIWPLQTLFRAMGAYFVRRDSKNALYRKVLERYVAMAVGGGVTQAFFPEGGLSRDGALRPPRLGLLDYMLRAFDPDGPRDLVFIPVGINLDRTLEDRTLLRDLEPDVPKKGLLSAAAATYGFLFRHALLLASNRWHRFGYACVDFGAPISLKGWCRGRGLDPRSLPKEERIVSTAALAGALMEAVARVVPVLPVPLVASVLVAEPERRWTELELKAASLSLLSRFEASGAKVYIPRSDLDYAITFGLRALRLRHLVVEEGGLLRPDPDEMPLLRYYANSIAHHVRAV